MWKKVCCSINQTSLYKFDKSHANQNRQINSKDIKKQHSLADAGHFRGDGELHMGPHQNTKPGSFLNFP